LIHAITENTHKNQSGCDSRITATNKIAIINIGLDDVTEEANKAQDQRNLQ
jgi:hypothetical protein